MKMETLEKSDCLQNTLKLIQQQPQVLNETSQNFSSLMLEVNKGHPDCVNALLEGGSNVNLEINGAWALTQCIENGVQINPEDNLKCLQVLIKAGARLYKLYNDATTPLMLAAMAHNDVCMEEILKVKYQKYPGISKMYDSSKMDTDVHLNQTVPWQRKDYNAPSKNNTNSVNFTDGYGMSALVHCLLGATDTLDLNNANCIRLLVTYGADMSVPRRVLNDNIVRYAICHGHGPNVIQALIDSGCPADLQDCLLHAAMYFKLELMKRFVKLGAICSYDSCLVSVVFRKFLKTVHTEQNIQIGQHVQTGQNVQKGLVDRNSLKSVTRYLISEQKAVVGAVENKRNSPINLAYALWLQNEKYCLEYLLSENCDCDDLEFYFYSDYYENNNLLELLKLLYNCGVPKVKLQCFIKNNAEVIGSWINTELNRPNSLLQTCVFAFRKILGREIKRAVGTFGIPVPMQNFILLKHILSEDCFQD